MLYVDRCLHDLLTPLSSVYLGSNFDNILVFGVGRLQYVQRACECDSQLSLQLITLNSTFRLSD